MRRQVNLTLISGAGLFILFLASFYYRKNVIPTPCSAAIVPLAKKRPSQWSLKCKDNIMLIEDSMDNALKEKIYHQIADDFLIVATEADKETLSKTEYVVLTMHTKYLKIEGMVAGSDLVKFLEIDNKGDLLTALSNYVKVKETPL